MKKLLLSLSLAIGFGLGASADTYKLVTDASTLSAGDKIIIATGSYALGTTQQTNYRKAESVTISNNEIVDPANTIQIITLEESGNTSFPWLLNVGDGYLNSPSASNYLKTSTTPGTTGAYFKITISSGKTQILSNRSTYEIQKNNSNAYFSCYKGTQTAVSIYRLENEVGEPVEMSWSSSTVSVNLGEELTNIPVLNVTPEAAKAEVKYESSNEGVATIDITTGAVTVNGAGKTTIKASISDSDTYKSAFATYELIVVDPNATEATFIFSEMGYTNQQVISTITGGIVTLSLDKGSNNNDPKYFTSSKDVRVYGGGTFSISVPDGFVIKQIISTFKTGTNNGLLCDDDGTLSTDNIEWTALSDLSTVTFKVSGTSGNCGWTKLVVKYEKAGDPTKADAGLKYDTTSYELTFGDAFTAPDLVNPNGLTVIYESNKPEVAEVDANTGAVTIKAPGVATITAKSEATDKYNAGSASYTLDIAAVASSIAQFETFGKNDSNLEIQVNFPMTVGFVNNQNLYLTDGVNWIQIYIKNSYNVGDVIPAGWTGQYTLYNDVTPQIKVVGTLPASTETAEVNYRKVSSFTENDVNEVLILTNAVLETASPSAQENFPVTVDGTSFTIRNNYKLPSVEPGVYDIKCVVNIYKPQNSEAQLQAYAIEFTPVVTEAPVMKVDGVEMSDFTGMQPINEDALISFEAANGETIWYRLSKVEATVNALAENADGFTLYENPFKVGDNNTLEFYAESAAGVKSEIKTLKFSVITGIEGVEVDAVNGVVEYFNLQGVKVEAPANGLYIRRQGTKVEKVIVK